MMEVNKNIIEEMINDPGFRRKLGKKSHIHFFHAYLRHFVKYRTADFHKKIFAQTQKNDNNIYVLSAFRNSGKSTIMTLSYPIWSIIGTHEKKFVLIINNTQAQARQTFLNVKAELETNDVLKQDLGPFREDDAPWGGLTLTIPNYDAQIMFASRGQGIRGIRHSEHRPDLVIIDDVENLKEARSPDIRESIYQWFKGDIIPAKGPDTDFVVIGTPFHRESLIPRLQQEIDDDELSGSYHHFPIIKDDGSPQWPAKFPDEEAIVKAKKKIGNRYSWLREYMLKIVEEDKQIILEEWIQHYNQLPDTTDKENKFRGVYIAVDPSFAGKEDSSYTAIVSAFVFGYGKNMRIYILGSVYNKQARYPEWIEVVKKKADKWSNMRPTILVEEVSAQVTIVDELKKEEYNAKGVNVSGEKSERLSYASGLVETGRVLFPKSGADGLITQLLYFNSEKHKDLGDAFSLLVNYLQENNRPRASWSPSDETGKKPITAGMMNMEF